MGNFAFREGIGCGPRGRRTCMAMVFVLGAYLAHIQALSRSGLFEHCLSMLRAVLFLLSLSCGSLLLAFWLVMRYTAGRSYSQLRGAILVNACGSEVAPHFSQIMSHIAHHICVNLSLISCR